MSHSPFTHIDLLLGKKYNRTSLEAITRVNNRGMTMFENKREKIKSTPFSDFVRNASSREKRKFFDKVIKETIAEQNEMIKKAQACS